MINASQNRVLYAVVPLEASPSPDLLRRWEQETREIVRDQDFRRPGKSLARWAAYLGGRVALRKLLQHISYEGSVVPNYRYGFLYLNPDPKEVRCVNISHTHRIAVAVMAAHPIGVDIESVHRSASRALERVCFPEERAAIPPQIRNDEGKIFPGEIATWSAKEAVSKATGLGIKFGMQAFVTDFSKSSPHPVELKVRGPLPLKDPAVRLIRYEDYVISLCTRKELLVAQPEEIL